MFERQVSLFKLKGFKVGMDWSWLILALWVTWSLATGLFPNYLEDLSTATYWWMGAAGAVGLFFSIVFHEFCHCLVARRYGMLARSSYILGGKETCTVVDPRCDIKIYIDAARDRGTTYPYPGNQPSYVPLNTIAAAEESPKEPRPLEKPPRSVPPEKPAPDPPRHLPPDKQPPQQPPVQS